MHQVTVLALPGVIPFDLGTPIEIFGRAVDAGGAALYEVTVAGADRLVRSGPVDLQVPFGLDQLGRAQTIVVPGRVDPADPVPSEVVDALQSAARNGARIASICVGAFDLAAAGLLAGLGATTHWRAATVLARLYPDIDVDPAALFIDNGQVLTSAGAAAGIDLCLHMIGNDYGGAVAAQAARTAVVPLTREANQAQYIQDDALGEHSLTRTLEWIETHAAEALTVADIARHAAVSPRTLHRRFTADVGVSPAGWLVRARIRRAQRLLETTDWPLERVAAETGLGGSSNLRARFHSLVGTSPSRYRHALKRR